MDNKILKAKVCVDKKEMEKKLNRIQFLTRELKKRNQFNFKYV
ncbi:hypothetical protein ACXAUS_004104 [Clostridium sporogenes]